MLEVIDTYVFMDHGDYISCIDLTNVTLSQSNQLYVKVYTFLISIIRGACFVNTPCTIAAEDRSRRNEEDTSDGRNA